MAINTYFHAAVASPDGSKIYVTGGNDSVSNKGAQVFTVATLTWATLAQMPNPHVEHGAAFAPDGRLYAVGGTSSGAVNAFDPNLGAWSTLTLPVTNNSGPLSAATTGDGRIVAVNNTSNSSGTYAYGPSLTSLSATSGFVGNTFSISGTNFAASANVSVYWGTVATGTLIGSGTTDATGALVGVTATVPAGATFGTEIVSIIDNKAEYPVVSSFFAGSITFSVGAAQTQTVGTTLSTPFVVTILGPTGAALNNANVTFTVSSGGGTLNGPTLTTLVVNTGSGNTGTASVTLTLGGPAGTQTVLAQAGGFTLALSATGTPGAPYTVGFPLQPPTQVALSTATVINAISPGVSASVVDHFNNPVTQTGWTISLTLTGPSSGGSAVLSGTTTSGPTPGATATFSNLSINDYGLYTLTGSATGPDIIQPGASAPFLVTYATSSPGWLSQPDTLAYHNSGAAVTGVDG